MRVGILCNGSVEDYAWLGSVVNGLDALICADGGTNHAYRLGLMPLVIVGDLDSVRPEILEHYRTAGVPVKQYPKEKDQTDLQLALAEAVARGAKTVLLLAATGKRLDHTLGNLSVLASLHAHGVEGIVLDENNDIRLWEKEALIEGEPGEEVSLLPLTTRVTGVNTENLKYAVKDGVFEIGNPYGISNVLTAKTARVKFAEGLLLTVKSRDAGSLDRGKAT